MPNDLTAPERIQIQELVLDFRWRMDVVAPENQPMLVMTTDHPRHGRLHYWLSKPAAEELRNWLTEAIPILAPPPVSSQN